MNNFILIFFTSITITLDVHCSDSGGNVDMRHANHKNSPQKLDSLS
jgi:hypothetical protein